MILLLSKFSALEICAVWCARNVQQQIAAENYIIQQLLYRAAQIYKNKWTTDDVFYFYSYKIRFSCGIIEAYTIISYGIIYNNKCFENYCGSFKQDSISVQQKNIFEMKENRFVWLSCEF